MDDLSCQATALVHALKAMWLFKEKRGIQV